MAEATWASGAWPAPAGYRMPETLAPLRHGRYDPAYRAAGGEVWRATRTPTGPATMCLRLQAGTVHYRAWGPGAPWAAARAPALLGADDETGGWQPQHEAVAVAAARYRGLRLARTGLVFESLTAAVLEQQVSAAEAWASWRRLLERFGEPAPGPAPPGLRVPPGPAQLLAVRSWEWHRIGVAPRRARTLRAAAAYGGRLEGLVRFDAERAARALTALPGVGEWSAAEVVQRSHGAPDAVSVGDYNLPGLVGWTLLGRRIDDADMLALLERYRPQRHRVTRLLALVGRAPPRRGPRLPVRDYRRI